MARKGSKPPSAARQASGRASWAKRRGFTPEGLQRLRESAIKNQPWRFSTGPRTAEGKAKVANNSRSRQTGPVSRRQLQAEIDFQFQRVLPASLKFCAMAGRAARAAATFRAVGTRVTCADD